MLIPAVLAGHATGKRKATARVYPRRKAGEIVRSTNKPVVLTREMLEPFFGTPLRNAAWHMGLCPTALKSVCRKLGINRWPYQQSRRPTQELDLADSALAGPLCLEAGDAEGLGDQMSSSSSMSGAATVEGEQSNSNSVGGTPSEEAPEECAPRLGRGDSSSSHLLDSSASSESGFEDDIVLTAETIQRGVRWPRSHDEDHAALLSLAVPLPREGAGSSMVVDDGYMHSTHTPLAYMRSYMHYFPHEAARRGGTDVPYIHSQAVAQPTQAVYPAVARLQQGPVGVAGSGPRWRGAGIVPKRREGKPPSASGAGCTASKVRAATRGKGHKAVETVGAARAQLKEGARRESGEGGAVEAEMAGIEKGQCPSIEMRGLGSREMDIKMDSSTAPRALKWTPPPPRGIEMDLSRRSKAVPAIEWSELQEELVRWVRGVGAEEGVSGYGGARDCAAQGFFSDCDMVWLSPCS
jgi:hypothetical protein